MNKLKDLIDLKYVPDHLKFLSKLDASLSNFLNMWNEFFFIKVINNLGNKTVYKIEKSLNAKDVYLNFLKFPFRVLFSLMRSCMMLCIYVEIKIFKIFYIIFSFFSANNKNLKEMFSIFAQSVMISAVCLSHIKNLNNQELGILLVFKVCWLFSGIFTIINYSSLFTSWDKNNNSNFNPSFLSKTLNHVGLNKVKENIQFRLNKLTSYFNQKVNEEDYE